MKKVLSIFITLTMLMSLFTTMCITASAESVDYGIYLALDGNAYKLAENNKGPDYESPITLGSGDLSGLTWNSTKNQWEMNDFSFASSNKISIQIESNENNTAKLNVTGTNLVKNLHELERSFGIMVDYIEITGNGNLEVISADTSSVVKGLSDPDSSISLAFCLSKLLKVDNGVTLIVTSGDSEGESCALGLSEGAKYPNLTINGKLIANSGKGFFGNESGFSTGLNVGDITVGKTGYIKATSDEALAFSSAIQAYGDMVIEGKVTAVAKDASIGSGGVFCYCGMKVSGTICGISGSINPEFGFLCAGVVAMDGTDITETGNLLAKSDLDALGINYGNVVTVHESKQIIAGLSKDGIGASATDVTREPSDGSISFGGETYEESVPLYALIGEINPEFITTADSGYYAPKADSTDNDKNGIIAYTSQLYNIIELSDVSEFGYYIYNSNEVKKAELTENKVADLTELDGWFYGFVKDIAVDDFGNTVVAKPYVKIGTNYFFGNSKTGTVNADKWLGQETE